MKTFAGVVVAVALALAGARAVAGLEDDLDEAIECGDSKEAVRSATEILKKSPNDFKANLVLAYDCEEKEKYREQAAHLEKCLQERPDDAAAMNSMAMACLNLGDVAKAEEFAKKALKRAPGESSVEDTMRQVEMVKAELAHPDAPPAISNVLGAAEAFYKYNKEIGNGPWAYLMSIGAVREKDSTIWKGSFITMVRSAWRPYPAELIFKAYPSGRISITRANRNIARMQTPKFSFNNYMRHFQIAKIDPAGFTAIEDSNDWPEVMRLKKGDKVVRSVTLASLVETGLADFNSRIAKADRIVVREGGVNWDKPTDKFTVLATISDPREIAAFGKLFAFAKKSGDDEWEPFRDIGLGCGCGGGPGIDWWKGDEKLAQTSLHHGKSMWWDGFTWDFILTEKSRKDLAGWFSAHSIPMGGDVGEDAEPGRSPKRDGAKDADGKAADKSFDPDAFIRRALKMSESTPGDEWCEMAKIAGENGKAVAESVAGRLADKSLNEPDKVMCIWLLGQAKQDSSLPIMKDVLKTASPTSLLYRATSQALVANGSDEAAACLLDSYRRNRGQMDEERRFDAMQAIAMLKYAPAVKDAEEFLKVDPDRFYWQIYFIFGLFDDVAVPMLCEKLNDSDERVRANALGAIRFVMPDTEETAKALLKRMETEKDPFVRYQIAETLEWNMLSRGEKGKKALAETFGKLLLTEKKGSKAAKFMRETVESKSSAPNGVKVKFRPDAAKFDAAYNKILDSGVRMSSNREAVIDLLYSSTRKDVAKLRELRRRALWRQSDECLYDYKGMTRIITMLLSCAPEE